MIEDVTHEEIQELTALYALDALTQREAREVEARLAQSDKKTETELRAFANVVASLSFASSDTTTPAEAKDKLFARLADEKTVKAKKPIYITPTMTSALSEVWHVRADQGEWKPYSEGVLMKMLMLDKTKGTVTTLLKIEPGGKLVRSRSIPACRASIDFVRPAAGAETTHQDVHPTGDKECGRDRDNPTHCSTMAHSWTLPSPHHGQRALAAARCHRGPSPRIGRDAHAAACHRSLQNAAAGFPAAT